MENDLITTTPKTEDYFYILIYWKKGKMRVERFTGFEEPDDEVRANYLRNGQKFIQIDLTTGECYEGKQHFYGNLPQEGE